MSLLFNTTKNALTPLPCLLHRYWSSCCCCLIIQNSSLSPVRPSSVACRLLAHLPSTTFADRVYRIHQYDIQKKISLTIIRPLNLTNKHVQKLHLLKALWQWWVMGYASFKGWHFWVNKYSWAPKLLNFYMRETYFSKRKPTVFPYFEWSFILCLQPMVLKTWLFSVTKNALFTLKWSKC